MESGCEQILKITDRILDGGEITEEEAKALIRTTDEDTMLLLACADKIRQKFSGRSVDLCAIVNARSGRCQEDCKFCAQSARYDTGIDNYTFLPEEEVMKAAQKAKEAGAARFDIVTAGRDQRNPKDFAEILHLIRRIRTEIGIEVCCSLGFLTQEQAYQLSEAGVNRLHCNIESAPSFFQEVCTTHTAEEKAENIQRAQKASCSIGNPPFIRYVPLRASKGTDPYSRRPPAELKKPAVHGSGRRNEWRHDRQLPHQQGI